MDDPRWLRFMTIGLVLAAVAVGYFLLSGTLSTKNTTQTGSQVSQASPQPTSSPTTTASPAVLGQNNRTPNGTAGTISRPTASPSPASAFEIISDRNRSRAQTGQIGQTAEALPRTGFPIGLALVLSASAAIASWGLRRFPR